MITVDQKEIIRREYFIKRKSMRQISREFHHSRKTIHKAILDPGIPVYSRKKPRGKPVTGPYLPLIKQWLEEDRQRPSKQRHTAKRIYDRLKNEYGFPGGERTVRREVSLLRDKIPDSHVPQTYRPADGATFDFGEAQVVMNGTERKVHLACMRLDYSSKFFVCTLPGERSEGLYSSHIDAFQYLEGVPERIRYDNMKQAVAKILKGRNRQEQSLWVAFRSHFLFEADYCSPGKGQGMRCTPLSRQKMTFFKVENCSFLLGECGHVPYRRRPWMCRPDKGSCTRGIDGGGPGCNTGSRPRGSVRPLLRSHIL